MQPMTGTKPLVLVIHQDSDMVEAVREALARHGFDVEAVTDGNEGINMLYHRIPDVVLAGSSVPELNGYQICRLVKNDPVMKKIPILLVADVAEKMDRFWGVKAGADDFLQKDEIPARLLKKVLMVLEIYDRLGDEEKRILQAANERNPFNIRTRLNQILDTSLAESTLMVEFRSLSDLIHDAALLNYMLFSLLESILEYDTAAIFYNDDNKGPRVMTLHLPEGRKMATAQVETLLDEFFAPLKARSAKPGQFELLESEVIGTLDDTAPPMTFETRYTKEVYVDGRLIGVFCLFSRKKVDYSRIFPLYLVEDEVRLLMKLRHLYSQAETLAITDSLTGLFNHKHFMMTLQREFKSAKRYELDLSLVVIGIDGFRELNEQWGHVYGDEALRTVAKIAEETFRTSDIMARFGGKNLAIILPQTAGENAFLPLQRFQAKVAKTPIRWQDEALYVSISCGLVSMTGDMAAVSDLIAQAEDAFKLARSKGSNRIEISGG